MSEETKECLNLVWKCHESVAAGKQYKAISVSRKDDAVVYVVRSENDGEWIITENPTPSGRAGRPYFATALDTAQNLCQAREDQAFAAKLEAEPAEKGPWLEMGDQPEGIKIEYGFEAQNAEVHALYVRRQEVEIATMEFQLERDKAAAIDASANAEPATKPGKPGSGVPIAQCGRAASDCATCDKMWWANNNFYISFDYKNVPCKYESVAQWRKLAVGQGLKIVELEEELPVIPSSDDAPRDYGPGERPAENATHLRTPVWGKHGWATQIPSAPEKTELSVLEYVDYMMEGMNKRLAMALSEPIFPPPAVEETPVEPKLTQCGMAYNCCDNCSKMMYGQKPFMGSTDDARPCKWQKESGEPATFGIGIALAKMKSYKKVKRTKWESVAHMEEVVLTSMPPQQSLTIYLSDMDGRTRGVWVPCLEDVISDDWVEVTA